MLRLSTHARKTILIGGVALLLAMWLLRHDLAAYYVWFRVVLTDRRETPDESWLRDLARSERGVQLAIADLNGYGGRSRGWAGAVLLNSPLPIDSQLVAIGRDISAPRGQRVDCLVLLYQRSGDTQYALEAFDLVAPSGTSEIAVFRGVLAQAVSTPEAHTLLTRPHDSSIQAEREAFAAGLSVRQH